MSNWRRGEALRGVPLFVGCTRKERNEIRSLACEMEVPAGQMLTKQGAMGREFFVIEQGYARVDVQGQIVALLGPGNFFGEMALLDERPRTATVVAEGPMRVLCFGHGEFKELLERVPPVVREMLRGISERLRGVEEPSP